MPKECEGRVSRWDRPDRFGIGRPKVPPRNNPAHRIASATSLLRGIATVSTLLALGIVLPTSEGRAETSAKDTQVIVKAIGFLSTKPTGQVPVAVVYDNSAPASRQDAEAIKTQLDGISGAVQPSAKIIPVDQLSAFSGAAAIIAAGSSPASFDAAAKAVHGRKILTVSTDPTCARSGKCVLAVKSEPKVEILLNSSAAQDAGVEFTPTFRMMISEI